MGLWDTLKQHAGAQYLEVIEWTDDSNNTIVYRFPVFNQAITDNSKLVVREGQAAVFVSEGKLSDVFGPGTYTLDTRNTPIMSFFETIKYNLNYPYKGDVYFVDTTIFRDNRWGTSNPFMMRDAEFGPVRVRAYGAYDFRITDPGVFLKQIVGTDGLFTTDEITKDLKKKLVSSLAAAINGAGIPVLDLASAHLQLGDKIRDEMNPRFNETYGLGLTSLIIENISLPPEVEKALDTRSKMGIIGNLDAYTKYKAADALETAAGNPGMGGIGMGMGVGMGMGNMVGQQLAGAANGQGQFNPQQGLNQGPSAAPPPLPQAASFHYNGAGGQSQGSAAQIANLIANNRTGSHMVWSAGWAAWKSWDSVPEIASLVPPPAAAPPPLPGSEDAVFHYAGPSGQSEKKASEVAALLKADADADHKVWKQGFSSWMEAADVPEIQAKLSAGGPPPLPGGGPPPL